MFCIFIGRSYPVADKTNVIVKNKTIQHTSLLEQEKVYNVSFHSNSCIIAVHYWHPYIQDLELFGQYEINFEYYRGQMHHKFHNVHITPERTHWHYIFDIHCGGISHANKMSIFSKMAYKNPVRKSVVQGIYVHL